MDYALRVSAPATQEALSLAEARAHLRVDSYDDDGIIAGLILAARQHVETTCGIVLCTTSLIMTMDDFPDCDGFTLPRNPVSAITAIRYYNASAVLTTWSSADYESDLNSLPPRVALKSTASWPSAQDRLAAVEVEFVAGYGGPELVPQAFKQAMLLLIGHWYENREAVNVGNITSTLDFTVNALLAPYRLSWL